MFYCIAYFILYMLWSEINEGLTKLTEQCHLPGIKAAIASEDWTTSFKFTVKWYININNKLDTDILLSATESTVFHKKQVLIKHKKKPFHLFVITN